MACFTSGGHRRRRAPTCSRLCAGSLITSAGFPCPTFSSVDIRSHETSRGELISMAAPTPVRIIILFVTVCSPVSVFAAAAELLEAPVPWRRLYAPGLPTGSAEQDEDDSKESEDKQQVFEV